MKDTKQNGKTSDTDGWAPDKGLQYFYVMYIHHKYKDVLRLINICKYD
jgi:hypothetical protein